MSIVAKPPEILVAPTEPEQLVALGASSSAPEEFGADVLIPTEGQLIGVQRKEFPGDFLSSLRDGRLSTSLVKLTRLPMRVLVLEGQPSWDFNGVLEGYARDAGFSSFSLAQLRGLLWSAQFELGVSSYWTTSISDTVNFVRDLQRWGSKARHESLFKRPNPVKPEWVRQWRQVDHERWILQGFDGVGPTVADAILRHFDGLPLRWTVTADELAEVPGIGPGRVRKLTKIVKPADSR